MKNNFLFTTTINLMVLVFICFMFKAFFKRKNWKHRFRPTALPFLFFVFFLYHLWLFIHLMKISGDVEGNSGSKHDSAQYLTICHENLNSILVHNFIKVPLLKAYPSVHEMDIICLSETYFDSSAPIDADNLQIPGYSSIRADHITIRGRVLIYYNNFLPIKLTDVKCLHEWLYVLVMSRTRLRVNPHSMVYSESTLYWPVWPNGWVFV